MTRIPFGLGLAQRPVHQQRQFMDQYFYLPQRARRRVVMASSATDAGHSEKTLRQKLLQTGHVDVVIAIGTNFFYTLTLPCTLWFFDKRKPAERRDKVLMLDARSVYHVVTRKLRDFTDEQLANLTAIVWLYRGEGERFLKLERYRAGRGPGEFGVWWTASVKGFRGLRNVGGAEIGRRTSRLSGTGEKCAA